MADLLQKCEGRLGCIVQEVAGTQKRSQAPSSAKKLMKIEEEAEVSQKEDSPDEIEDDSDFEA